MANKKFSDFADNPDTVLTTPAPSDLVLIWDNSEPLDINRVKVITFQNLVNLAAQSALQALVSGQTAGDTFYANSATALARLAKGTAGQVLSMNSGATAPEWKTIVTALVAGRQGGSSTHWNVQGTNNYVPGESIIQCGTIRINISSTNQYVSVTFPSSFSYAPVVFLTMKDFDGAIGGDNYVVLHALNTSTSNFYLTLNCDSNFNANNNYADIFWLAIGLK